MNKLYERGREDISATSAWIAMPPRQSVRSTRPRPQGAEMAFRPCSKDVINVYIDEHERFIEFDKKLNELCLSQEKI